MKFKKTSTALLIGSLFCVPAFAKTHKILLLGCTGDGKTTTLNAIYNSAIYTQTPKNSLDSIKFIQPINQRLKCQIPQILEPDYLGQAKTQVYASNNTGWIRQNGGHDTINFTGYQFTPTFLGWPNGDSVEIIDTPGIDCINSNDFKNNSWHLQDTLQLEQYLREYGDDISAVFFVTHASDSGRYRRALNLTLNAVHEALPANLGKRLFVIMNDPDIRGEKKQYDFFDPDKNPLYAQSNYTAINPRYLKSFNAYITGHVSPKVHQLDRNITENNLHDALIKVTQIEGLTHLKNYAEYIEYKHQVAAYTNTQTQRLKQVIRHIQHAQDTCKVQEANTETHAHLIAFQKAIQDIHTTSAYRNLNELSVNNAQSAMVFINSAMHVAKKLKSIVHTHIYASNNRMQRLTADLDKILFEADQYKQQLKDYPQAITALHALHTCTYGVEQQFSDEDITNQVSSRIKVHFPKIYRAHKDEHIEALLSLVIHDLHTDVHAHHPLSQ